MLIIVCVAIIPISAVFAGQDGAGPGQHAVVVVIDPGHGGDDAGAVGARGTLEKNVALGIAQKVAVMLREKGFIVLLTRTDDTFVELKERTVFANRNMADVFISIHANAAPSRAVDGVETFFLSLRATDDEALELAAFENTGRALRNGSAGDMPVGGDMAVGGDLGDILADLEKSAAHHESGTLAGIVHASVLKASGREDRGVKQAPFVVLSGAWMPAILVEVAFISNPAEEKRLASDVNQLKIAAAIADGVDGFKNKMDKGGSYVGLDRK